MAYNPFNIFRRNQKALFAVLTVFIMIMFTLSFGQGDIFERVNVWLGSARGEAVCTIDGQKIKEGELQGPRGLEARRVMANRFMYHAALQTTGELLAYANQQRERLSEPGKVMADSARRALNGLAQLNDPQFINNPQIAQFLLPQILQQIERSEQLIGATLEAPGAKSEDKDVARAYQTVFNLRRQLTQSGEDREHYFLNAPSKTRRDQIEFLLWQKKAEQLGIDYNREDVKKLIEKEFYGFFKSDVEVRKILQQSQGFSIELCMEALAEEFEVRSAQTALLGYGGRFHRAPVYPIPYEVFEYYREQCSPATYDVIPVPAAAFVDRVQGTPSESEIKDLFRKYENDEPNPRTESPGFKEPRKIVVSFLGITGEEPYYKKLAEEQIKIGEVMAKASGALSVPIPGAAEAWAARAAGALALKEPAVDAAYGNYKTQFEFQRRSAYTDPSIVLSDLLPSSVVRPGALGATAGALVGQTAGMGSPVAAVAMSVAAPIAYEVRDRVKVGVPLVLGFVPGPATIPTIVGASAASDAMLPKPLPVEAKRPDLLKDTIDARAKALAFGSRPDVATPATGPTEKGDVQRFIDELAKLAPGGKPKDEAAVKKYIQEFIATRGITSVGASAAPHDEWSLEDDPGLQPLVIAHKESLLLARGAHGQTEPYFPFGQSFFWDPEVDFMNPLNSRRGKATAGTYQASRFPPSAADQLAGRPHYVVWRTEDIPAKKLTFDDARPEVVAAWKRMKARELAEQSARQLADSIRAYGKTEPFFVSQFVADKAFERQRDIQDPKVRQRARKFTIDNVCPFIVGQGNLRRFELTESENIPYPTPEMQKELLDNRDKPTKTVVVMPNAPKDVFYVATLIDRNLRMPGDFAQNVYSRTGSAQQVRGLYQEEAIKKARESVVDLLKKEFNYQETDEQKQKLDDNAKSGKRNSEE